VERLAAHRRDDLLVESGQRRPVFGLDDAEHVGLEVDHDPCRVAHRMLVDRLVAQLQGADPVSAAIRGDHDAARLRPPEQTAPVAPEDDERAGVGFRQAEVGHQSDHPLLVGGAVVDLAEKLVQLRKRLEHGTSVRPGLEIHRLGAVEQVFDVVGCESHGRITS
jgi:hypothetical protein